MKSGFWLYINYDDDDDDLGDDDDDDDLGDDDDDEKHLLAPLSLMLLRGSLSNDCASMTATTTTMMT